MTDNDLGSGLLALYVQLTPWVQAFLAFTVCVLVLGVAWLFKETVAALTHPFVRPSGRGSAPKGTPSEIHDD